MLNTKKLLLIDAIGALLSALLLTVVLTRFESAFGMPKKVSYLLGLIAFIFAAYSLLSYVLTRTIWKAYLRIIAFSNLVYCCVTIGVVIYFKNELTSLGFIYFLAEIGIIVILANFELNVSSKIISKR